MKSQPLNACVLFFLIGAGHLFGESPTSNIRYDAPTELTPGVTHRHASDESVPWQIEIIEIDMTHPTVEIISIDALSPTLREPLSALAQRGRAVAAINAGFFNMESGQSVSHFELDDQVHAFNRASSPPRSVMGISTESPPTVLTALLSAAGEPTTPIPAWKKVVHAIGGGPALIRDGAIVAGKDPEGFSPKTFVQKRHPRTAMGVNSKTKRVFWVTVDGRQPEWSVGMSLPELAHLMADLGCDQAINYDGGGSTTCWVKDKVINRPSGKEQRAISNAWIVRTTSPTILVDNLDSEMIRTDAWAVASETGCHATDSIVHLVGSDKAVATWTTAESAPGRYLAEAWWVSAPDRTELARYTVTCAETSQTVIVNQREWGSRWYPLGEIDVPPNEHPTVSLVADGSQAMDGSDRYISADAVRFTYLGPLEPAAKSAPPQSAPETPETPATPATPATPK